MFSYLEIESLFCINLTCVVSVVSAKENLFQHTQKPADKSAGLAPQVGLEPTTLRLTAECSAIELLRQELNPATTYSPGPLPAKYHQRAEA